MGICDGTASYKVVKIRGTEVFTTQEQVIEEIPFTIYLNGKELVTMLASAGDEKYLIIGFLATEGVIKTVEDLKKLDIDTMRGIVNVETIQGETAAEKMFLKRYLTACCGKGRSTFYFANDVLTARSVTTDLKVSPEEISKYSAILEDKSETFKLTGGVHGGGLAARGEFVCWSQDVGRHNVFDKLYGRCLVDNITTSDKIIVFSGRVSSEILLKVSKMDIPIIVSRGAPTSLAIDMAEELGITVVGFARDNRMNVYTHSNRVIGS